MPSTGSYTTSFEKELSQKQSFYLFLYQLCPSIDILHKLWKLYKEYSDKEIVEFHKTISPYKQHPCGNDSMFRTVGGFIDPDIFLDYYFPREKFLLGIKIIGHPLFICQFTRTKEQIEDCINYDQVIINETQKKLTPCKKVNVLNRCIDHLIIHRMDVNQIMRYLYSHYKMYKENRILISYPIGIDINDKLCRFE